MKVVSADYVTSAVKPEQYPAPDRPEIAFAGRSNVGKSTLLNTLLRRNGLAKTSKTPGKTRTVNFFNVNDRLYFVDLPGYGYARVSKSMKKAWSAAISSYLFGRETLRMAVHLVDSRHEPMARDEELLDLLERAEVPTLVLATKVDKLKASQRAKNLALIREGLGLGEDALVLPCSAVTREGIGELWRVIDERIA